MAHVIAIEYIAFHALLYQYMFQGEGQCAFTCPAESSKPECGATLLENFFAGFSVNTSFLPDNVGRFKFGHNFFLAWKSKINLPDGEYLDIVQRSVLAVYSHLANGIKHIESDSDLAKDGVFPGKPVCIDQIYKKL